MANLPQRHPDPPNETSHGSPQIQEGSPGQRTYFRPPQPSRQQPQQLFEGHQVSNSPVQLSNYHNLQSRPGPSAPHHYPEGQYLFPQQAPRYGPSQPLPGYDQVARDAQVRDQVNAIEMGINAHNPETQPSNVLTSDPSRQYPVGRQPYSQTDWQQQNPQQASSFHQHVLPGGMNPSSENQATRPSLVRSESHEVLVGKEGFPPAIEPRGQKTRFSAEEDILLRQLKEREPKLSWKQIADFFPHRKSGTLQVRYCTKLKTKSPVVWSDDLVNKVKEALAEDRAGQYHRVALKIGEGLSAEAIERKITSDAEDEEARQIQLQQGPEELQEATADSLDSSSFPQRREWS